MNLTKQQACWEEKKQQPKKQQKKQQQKNTGIFLCVAATTSILGMG